MLTKLNNTVLTATAALVGGIAALTASPAHAESGMRVCGYAAYDRHGNVTAYLKKLQMSDASYGKDCKSAIERAKTYVLENPKVPWEMIGKQNCEEINEKIFLNNGTKPDICAM
ncbi:hypothetical protein [Novosphingobium sp. Chol11]|uniref:hypothetical protein n=1 Tax=Novosphingobium sp. Chol11 TaxID=1385763 RepID=UPI0025D97935|nr:hypothetical protein [Novosphingobium sp. Chol11]